MNEYIQVDTNKSMLDTYLANLIEEVEKYQRPRLDGSIDWSKAKPNIIELIKVIGGKAYNRGVEDTLQGEIKRKRDYVELTNSLLVGEYANGVIDAHNEDTKLFEERITKLTNK